MSSGATYGRQPSSDSAASRGAPSSVASRPTAAGASRVARCCGGSRRLTLPLAESRIDSGTSRDVERSSAAQTSS
eukprot:7013556-Prymnesium_polylepis.2